MTDGSETRLLEVGKRPIPRCPCAVDMPENIAIPHDESQLGTLRTLATPLPSFQYICHTFRAVVELVHSKPDGGQGVSYCEITQASPLMTVSVTIPVSNVMDAGMSAAIAEGDQDDKLGIVHWGNLY